jgi:hypothetical protein
LFDIVVPSAFSIYDGDTVQVTKPKNISPYLIDGPDLFISTSAVSPLCMTPENDRGASNLTDGGFLMLSDDERMPT